MVSDGFLCILKSSGHLERGLTLEKNTMFQCCNYFGVQDLFVKIS